MDQVPAWIVAGMAIVQVLVTGMLCWVTFKYVRLTHNLSKTADRQLALLRDTEFHRRRADLIDLRSLARRLLKSLEELPATKDDPDASGRLLFASLWRPEEVGELRMLAAKAGMDFAEKAEQPAVDLNWLLERIHPVRSEKKGLGLEMSSFRWDDYGTRILRAKDGLIEIADKAIGIVKSTTLNTGH